MLVRRLMTALVVCSLSLGVASCAEEEPTPKFAEPTSSAPSPTVVESDPVERESAEDFIRRLTEEANRAQVVGDTAAYRKLAPRCDSCQSFADRVDEIYAEGGTIEFRGVEIESIKPIAGTLHGFQVRREVPVTVVRDASGTVEQELPGGREVLHLYLTKTSHGWLLARLLRAGV